MINGTCRNLKYKRNIVILTDGLGVMDFDPEHMESIAAQLKEHSMILKVIGVDFDDEISGFKEHNKPPRKAHNEKMLQRFCEMIPDSVFATVEEAVVSLNQPRIRVIRPVRNFQGQLTLGNPEEYEDVISIAVEGFSAVRRATAPSATSYAPWANVSASPQTTTGSYDKTNSGAHRSGLQTVNYLRDYFIKDEKLPGGTLPVEQESLDSGYRYGSEIVTLTEYEKNMIGMDTQAGLAVVGFVLREKIDRWKLMSTSDYIVGRKDDEESQLGLSSFVHALYETDCLCIARYVPRDGRDVQMVILAPFIEPDFEALVLCRLPFAEDERKYEFPSLERIKTKTGKEIQGPHPFKPSEEIIQAMSQIVDDMDLMTAGFDFDGNPSEYMTPDLVYNPMIHRIRQVIKTYAITDDNHTIPPILPVLLKYSNPPNSVLDKAVIHAEKLKVLLDLERKETKEEVRKRKQNGEEPSKYKSHKVKALTDLDLDSLLNDGDESSIQTKSEEMALPKKDSSKASGASTATATPTGSTGADFEVEISPLNAIPDFKEAIAQAKQFSQASKILQAFEAMAEVIQELAQHSSSDLMDDVVISYILVLKSEALDNDLINWYQAFFNELTTELKQGDLANKIASEC